MKNIFSAFIVTTLVFLQNCSPKIASENLIAQNSKPVQVSNKFDFTEGPAADSKGNVYFTDQPNDKIYIWDWKTNNVLLFSERTGRANGTYFDADDNLYTCSDNNGEIWKFYKNGNISIITTDFEGKRLNGPNDLWIDSSSGIYFTDPLYQRSYWRKFKQEIQEKNLYYRFPKGIISKLDTFVQPNGIIGSETFKKLYVSDIDAGKTYVYDILGEGKLSEKRLFCEMGSDGMTLDKLGNLYLTGKGVHVFNRDGKKMYHIPIEEEWTSNVTFGGKNNEILFITASKSVYTLPTKVKGVK